MTRDVLSTKHLFVRNLFRLFWKNILTGLTENYMFKNNCRFYDFHPASQASHFHSFCFGRLMNFRQFFFCTAAEAHFWSLDLGFKHWKDTGRMWCTRRGCTDTNTFILKWNVLNLTNSLHRVAGLWKSWAMLHWRPPPTQKQCFLFKSEGILLVQPFISAQGLLFEMSTCL